MKAEGYYGADAPTEGAAGGPGTQPAGLGRAGRGGTGDDRARRERAARPAGDDRAEAGEGAGSGARRADPVRAAGDRVMVLSRPEQVEAYNAVAQAIRDGALVRAVTQACAACNRQAVAVAPPQRPRRGPLVRRRGALRRVSHQGASAEVLDEGAGRPRRGLRVD